MANVQWHLVQGDRIADHIEIYIVLVDGQYAGWFDEEFDSYEPDGTFLASSRNAINASHQLHVQFERRRGDGA